MVLEKRIESASLKNEQCGFGASKVFFFNFHSYSKLCSYSHKYSQIIIFKGRAFLRLFRFSFLPQSSSIVCIDMQTIAFRTAIVTFFWVWLIMVIRTLSLYSTRKNTSPEMKICTLYLLARRTEDWKVCSKAWSENLKLNSFVCETKKKYCVIRKFYSIFHETTAGAKNDTFEISHIRESPFMCDLVTQ